MIIYYVKQKKCQSYNNAKGPKKWCFLNKTKIYLNVVKIRKVAEKLS